MSKTIQEQEEQLFAKWIDTTNLPSIIKDGVVSEATFQNIVFVLKEVNGGEDWDLREHLRQGGQGKTWNNIVRWTKGMLNLDKHYTWAELDYISNDDRKNELARICAMNVKKIAGKGSAKDKEVYEFGHKHIELLQEQMEIYTPKIIVCCGMGSDMFSNIFPTQKEQMTDRGIWYMDNGETMLINYFHPNAHISGFFLYYGLIDAIHYIIKERENKIS